MLTARGNFVLAGIALVLAVAAMAVIVVVLNRGPGASSGPGSVAAGETIYRAGTFEGQAIPRRGGFSGGMMGGWGAMMSAGCATCHGLDGHGLATRSFTSPNITYANLTDPQGMLAPDGSRGPTYTDAALKKAVTTGIDPNGDHLAAPMPRWQLTDQEGSDLLAYLKTLH